MTTTRPPFRQYVKRIAPKIRGKAQERVAMKSHTTFRIGGFASVMVWPFDPASLALALETAREMELPSRVVGAGSNLLVGDGGLPEVVINLTSFGTKGEERCEVVGKTTALVEGEEREARLVRLPAGLKLPQAVKELQTRSLAGLEFAAGIPGTVGGAAIMNAGSMGGSMSLVIRRLTWRLPEGEERTIERDGLVYSYRRLERPEAAVVLSCEVALVEDDPRRIRERIVKGLKWRRQHQPLSHPSAGSVFKNPEGDHAGRLIEAAGLKGERLGDAQISEVHANFIVNRGRARSRDVQALIELARERVTREFGVDLELEIESIGEEIE